MTPNKKKNMRNSTYSIRQQQGPRNKLLLTNWTSLSWKDLKKTKHSIDKIITKIENPDEIIIDGSFKRARTGLLISK